MMAITDLQSGSGSPLTDSTAGDAGSDGQQADGSTAADETDHELPLDQLFELLKNSRRRRTLSYLTDNGGEATLSDLAEHIAAIENDVPIKAITSSQRKRVYVGLYQCHLPKLDDRGVVEFDDDRGTVTLTPAASQLDPYLGNSESVDWWQLYLGVTAGGSGLLGASLLGGATVGLTPTVVTAAVLAVLALCSALHAYDVTTDTAVS